MLDYHGHGFFWRFACRSGPQRVNRKDSLYTGYKLAATAAVFFATSFKDLSTCGSSIDFAFWLEY